MRTSVATQCCIFTTALKPDAHFHGYAVDDTRKKVDELFDLEADLGERTNLAAKHPKIVAQLKQLMEDISKWK